jgi:hypothetical protein
MAHQDFCAYSFDTALVPVVWCVCGVKLRPFCLGHYLLLKHIHNPMMDDDETEATMEQTLLWFFETLLLCAATYEDGLSILGDDELHKETMGEFTENLNDNMKAEPGWNIFDKLRLFREYIAYYMQFPWYTEERESKNVTPSGTDWTQNLYVTFKKLGYTESQILNMPMRKLFYEWCSFAEGEGAIKVMNKMDVEMLARARGLI